MRSRKAVTEAGTGLVLRRLLERTVRSHLEKSGVTGLSKDPPVVLFDQAEIRMHDNAEYRVVRFKGSLALWLKSCPGPEPLSDSAWIPPPASDTSLADHFWAMVATHLNFIGGEDHHDS